MSRRTRLDLLVYFLIAMPVLCLILLVECGIVPALSPLGFRCSDPKLSYKYRGDTISPRVLIIVTISLPLFVVMTTEWWGRKNKSSHSDNRSWWRQALIWYRDFLSGLLFVLTVTVLIKGIVGEPRPHFLDTCKPKEAINCTNEFISKFECANENISAYYIQDASKSFPSGHASFSFYLFVFIAWFLQKRLDDVRPSVIVWLQTLALSWALGCSLSRLTDHRHHWWDILAGAFIGSAVAICSIKSFSFGFKTKEKECINSSDTFQEKSAGSLVFISQEETSDTSMKWLISNIDRPPNAEISPFMALECSRRLEELAAVEDVLLVCEPGRIGIGSNTEMKSASR
ncbi:phospholipid phosphatase 1-like isoform X2 [Rhodnius prolixus]|uniref:phospholipid phosphatase 1-like isoform X2 n=1 Tax=Rhodnius prolixus TaxID=13249 RepID=UPI003D18BC10